MKWFPKFHWLQIPKFGSISITINHNFFLSTKPWDPDRCLVQFEKDGIVQTKEKSQRQRNSFSYSQNWAGQQKVSHSFLVFSIEGFFLGSFRWADAPLGRVWLDRCVFLSCGWTASTGSQAASRPAAVRTRRAAVPHQNPIMSHPTMKASHRVVRLTHTIRK